MKGGWGFSAHRYGGDDNCTQPNVSLETEARKHTHQNKIMRVCKNYNIFLPGFL
jgi:hypothetical protein